MVFYPETPCCKEMVVTPSADSGRSLVVILLHNSYPLEKIKIKITRGNNYPIATQNCFCESNELCVIYWLTNRIKIK